MNLKFMFVFVLINVVSINGGFAQFKNCDPLQIYETIIYQNESIYKGCTINGKFNGLGEYIFPNYSQNRKSYSGNFKNGNFEGKGKLIFVDGSIIESDNFSDDKITGKGKKLFQNGDIYDGQFNSYERSGQVAYEISGQGTYYKKNRLSIESFFLNDDFFSGITRVKFNDGSIANYNIDRKIDIKNFENEIIDGEIIYQNGDKYSGILKGNKKYGNGIFIRDNGDKISADFFQTTNIIYGKIKFSNDNIYEGKMTDYLPFGYGKLYLTNGDIIEGNFSYYYSMNEFMLQNGLIKFKNNSDYIMYRGKILNNNMEGEANILLKDGKNIFGYFENNILKYGRYKMVDQDALYEGPFYNNMKNGLASRSYSDGRKVISVYKNDILIKDIKIIYENGREYSLEPFSISLVKLELIRIFCPDQNKFQFFQTKSFICTYLESN